MMEKLRGVEETEGQGCPGDLCESWGRIQGSRLPVLLSLCHCSLPPCSYSSLLSLIRPEFIEHYVLSNKPSIVLMQTEVMISLRQACMHSTNIH